MQHFDPVQLSARSCLTTAVAADTSDIPVAVGKAAAGEARLAEIWFNLTQLELTEELLN